MVSSNKWYLTQLHHGQGRFDGIKQVVVGVGIDINDIGYNIGIIDLVNKQSFSECLNKSQIVDQLHRLGFTDLDASAIQYFMTNLYQGLVKGIEDHSLSIVGDDEVSATTNHQVQAINVPIKLPDVTWYFKLSSDLSILYDYIDVQCSTINKLDTKLHNSIELLITKDHYMRYSKDSNAKNPLLSYAKKNKHLNIDFSLLNSFDESKWKVDFPKKSENELLINNLHIINEFQNQDTRQSQDGKETDDDESQELKTTIKRENSDTDVPIKHELKSRVKKPQGIIRKRKLHPPPQTSIKQEPPSTEPNEPGTTEIKQEVTETPKKKKKQGIIKKKR